MNDIELMRDLNKMKAEIQALRTIEIGPTFVPLAAPLTSTAWDGDSFSTTAKTLIDLSAVFGAPAGVKAISVRSFGRDSGSASNTTFAILSPNNVDGVGPVSILLTGVPNDGFVESDGIVPCNDDGDIYYQVKASGAGTMDIFLQIWGYWL